MVSSRSTEHHQGAHHYEFLIELAPQLHCNMLVQEQGAEGAPVGDLHLYADVLPARSNVYEDLPLLQALLRFNDRTSSAKVPMREDGGIRLAIDACPMLWIPPKSSTRLKKYDCIWAACRACNGGMELLTAPITADRRASKTCHNPKNPHVPHAWKGHPDFLESNEFAA